MKNKKLLKLLEGERTVLIIGSNRLDYDCIGSGLILKKYLESLGKKVTFIFPSEITDEERKSYDFLSFFDEVEVRDTRQDLSQKKFDVLMLIDGANFIQFYDYDREEKAPTFSAYDKRIYIDHHSKPENLGTYTIHDPKASAVAEVILTKIIPEEFIDEKIATLGYAAIVGDTGNFQWNFTPKTLNLAGLLIKKGAKWLEVINKAIYSYRQTYFEMLAFAINNLEYYSDVKTVLLCLPWEKLKEFGIDGDKLDELKLAFDDGVAARIRGYERGIMIREEKPGRIKISARGNNLYNKINMPRVFQELGGNGGGHFNACGFGVKGDFKEVKKALIELIKKHI